MESPRREIPVEPVHKGLRGYAKAVYLKLRRFQAHYLPSIDNRKVWQEALPDELQFWQSFLSTGGLEWPEDFARRTNRNSLVIDPLITAELDRSAQETISILDVGAGPLTAVGTRYPGKRITLTAIDPLGAAYDTLLERNHITPPVRTLTGAAEELTKFFEPETFDVAYARNSLDHAYDPVLSISNMLRVTKRTGKVLLRHKAHEAENIHYFGLHQWNFEIDDGCFIIWSRGQEHNVTKLMASEAEVSCARENEWILCTISRHR